MIRASIQVLGPLITLVGVLLSIWGTYLLTLWYHTAKNFTEFAKAIIHVVFLYLMGRREDATRFVQAEASMGELNPERRARSLGGVVLIFVGFILQAVGAIMWGADMIWGIFEKKPPCGG